MKVKVAWVLGGMVWALSVSAFMTETTAHGLSLTLDRKGRISRLVGAGEDRIHADAESCLISVREYEKNGMEWNVSNNILKPEKMSVVRESGKEKILKFSFPGNGEVDLKLTNKGDYLRFEIVKTVSANGIAVVQWGPYTTSLHDTVGKFLGVVRNKAFALGVMGLDLRTDGASNGGMGDAAYFHNGATPGGVLRLLTIDHTRPIRYNNRQFISVPAADAKLEGAAVALWGVGAPTKDRELDLVEKIVQAEGLPYPTIDGVWAKKSPRANESAFWIDYSDTNIDDWIKVGDIAGIRLFSRYNCFANWGHFDPDLRAFTNGWASLRTCSEKAKAHGIRTTTYTLSTFTRAFSQPEKFIAPVLDPRFNTYVDSRTVLAWPLPGIEGGARARPTFAFPFWSQLDNFPREIVSNRIHLVKHPKHYRLYGHVEEVECEKVKMMTGGRFKRKFINVGGELISYRTAATNATELVLMGCERGFYGSPIQAHPAGAPVVRMDSYDGYDSLLPGSDAMNDEIARNIAAATRKGGMGNVILDGVERADRSGNDLYSVNRFVKTIYDNVPRESTTFVGSRMTHYTWHLFTNQSWGEHDMKRGIRGSQFEWRLTCQLNLRNNHYPNKLGQYYPSRCSMKDIDWIMAFATAYDAGVDFSMGLPKTYEKFERIRLWEDARRAGAFTEKDKMRMRQTDTEWSLSKENGKFKLAYVGRWIGDKFEELAPTNAPLTARGPAVKIAPRSIDRTWAHAPGQCERWCITDDIVADVSVAEQAVDVVSPIANEGYGKTVPLFVLRAQGAAVVNPVVHYRTGKGAAFSLRIKTTLRPGEYVTIPHRASIAFVYTAQHEMVRDLNLENLPPHFPYGKGKTIRVSITSDNTEPVPAKLNLRFVESSI